MRLCQLDRVVLRVGPQPLELLQGTATNTIDAQKTAFLDVFGKIVVVADQLKLGGDVLLIIGKPFYERLMKHLNQYLILCPTKVVRENYLTYFNLDADYHIADDEYIIPQPKGQLLITRDDLNCSVSPEEFRLFRLQNNIPLQGVDFDQEMALNVGEDFISFTKGCFVGQEVIARVKNKSKPPKKLAVQDGKFVMVENG